ncbi:MAG: His/Gly/Thr/Pro-type tRNA ligase C-terminal domain-containing protein, partial [Mucinivorans sp.]
IYDVMREKGLFPASIHCSARALVANFSEAELLPALQLVEYLRAEGIAVEIYPSSEKIKKQFDYATSKAIPYMIFLGEKEVADGVVTVKNLATGEQTTAQREKIAELLK